ncbi:hypothetical protein O9G_006406, partial [Rozella allomycis CSF55]
HTANTKRKNNSEQHSSKKPTFYCEFHKGRNVKHNTEDCKSLKYKNQKLEKEKAKEKNTDKESNARKVFVKKMCNLGCGQEYEPGHNDVCLKRKKKDPQMRKIEIQKLEEILESDEEIHFKMTKGPDKTKFLYTAATLSGLKVKAGIDTMSTNSFVSPKLFQVLNLQVQPVQGV